MSKPNYHRSFVFDKSACAMIESLGVCICCYPHTPLSATFTYLRWNRAGGKFEYDAKKNAHVGVCLNGAKAQRQSVANIIIWESTQTKSKKATFL